MTTTLSRVREQAEAARDASKRLAVASTDAKNAALERVAVLLVEREGAILAENAKDLAAGREAGLDDYFLERLTLTPARIAGMAADTRHIASLPDPVGETIDARTLPNGLQISRKRVPLGVVACIYESRPNVTIDIATLCLKSGNAAVLRGARKPCTAMPCSATCCMTPSRGRTSPPGRHRSSATPIAPTSTNCCGCMTSST